MADRSFPFETIVRDGRPCSAMRIECGKCDAKAYMAQTGVKRKPNEAAEQYFRNHGWRVGNGPRADLCPSCQPKRPELKVVNMEQPAKAEAPREMTRDDRRIVFAKIDEVYEKDRYSHPWTDGAVARDLGVPQAWVALVRDEMFGPEGGNPVIDGFLRQAEPILKECRDLVNAARSLIEEGRKIADRVDELERTARAIERDVKNPNKVARRA